MTEFKTLSVIKYPIEVTWEKMRDNLPEIVEFLDDIEKVLEKDRIVNKSNIVNIINIWYASPKIPSLIKNYIKSEMLTWTDNASWDENIFQCNWTIKPHAFADHVECKGITKFESAIAGRGTKITFSGFIDLSSADIKTALLGGITFNLIESFIVKLIPNNFIKLTNALSSYLILKKKNI